MTFKSILGMLTLSGALALPVWAAESASTSDFKAVDSAFERHKNIAYTGNPDVDFRTHLIARRRSIIGMAEVAQARATDPQTTALAQKVIASQKRDIAELQKWLNAHKTH